MGCVKAKYLRSPFMKKANIPAVETEIDWSKIPVLPIAEPIKTEETKVQAFAQICYNEQALHIRLTAIEPEIRKEETGSLGMPCMDSCLEFFICPEKDDLRYFNFEFNPNGCLYLGFGSGPQNLIRLILSDVQQRIWFAPVVEVTEDAWNICFQIPYFFIQQFFPGFQIQTSSSLRGNFCKCGELLQQPHYLAWNRVTEGESDFFHSPREFGFLYL